MGKSKTQKSALEILNSIELQNERSASILPSEDLDEYEQEFRYEMGEIDEWENATGEFGRNRNNPILVNGKIGEIAYLSRLVNAETGQRMIFHKLGYTIDDDVHIFELVSEDGKFYDILYLDMYHYHCSKKAPSGYRFLQYLDGITGSNRFCRYFPYQHYLPHYINFLEDELRDASVYYFGTKIISKVFKNFDAMQAKKTVTTNRPKNNFGENVICNRW